MYVYSCQTQLQIYEDPQHYIQWNYTRLKRAGELTQIENPS